jgi:hypothetical protein
MWMNQQHDRMMNEATKTLVPYPNSSFFVQNIILVTKGDKGESNPIFTHFWYNG